MRLTNFRSNVEARRRLTSAQATGLVAIGLLTVFILDRVTGAMPLQHLYYVPIILAGVSCEVAGGVLTALTAIVLYHVANPHLLTFAYEASDVVQIGLFLLVGIVTATLTREANLMRRVASTDDLTGLHNLRSFEARLSRLVREARERQERLAMLVLDVDRLKSLNDSYGHLTGAAAVRTVGQIVAQRLPARGIACRYGGDEFAIAIPQCSPSEAHRVADDIRTAVNAQAPLLDQRRFSAGTLSVSIGTVCATFAGAAIASQTLSDEDIGEALFKKADTVLYRAKLGGRNRVATYKWSVGASDLERHVPPPDHTNSTPPITVTADRWSVHNGRS